MADVIDQYGVGTLTGTMAAPETILTLTTNVTAVNFLTLRNRSATNYLFAKSTQDPGPYQVAGPGEEVMIACGPQGANNLNTITGFGGSPPPNHSAGQSIVISVGSKKRA